MIEFFVTHLQAEQSKTAKTARISQIRQLMEQVDRSKSEADLYADTDAVIVAG